MSMGSLSAAVFVVASFGGGIWWAATELATKDEVFVVAVGTNYALDKLMEYTLVQINLLEQKIKDGRATQSDVEQLRYHRAELQRLREMRGGR